MNVKVFLAAIIFASSFVFTSCDDDDDDDVAKPVVSVTELGANNEKTGIVGQDLHVNAKVETAGKFDYAVMEILSIDKKTTIADSTYNDEGLKGTLNTTFHRHIDIPGTVTAGKYIFQLAVFDQIGQSTTVEDTLAIKVSTDETVPVITITKSGAPENKKYAKGEEITISGKVTDNESLAGLYIGLVRKNQNLENAKVTHENTITILHTHSFENPKSYDIDASIKVGASTDNDFDGGKTISEKDDFAWESGEYYVIVKSKDAAGNWGYSDQYPLTIQLSE